LVRCARVAANLCDAEDGLPAVAFARQMRVAWVTETS
jgi:hypothetical protein